MRCTDFRVASMKSAKAAIKAMKNVVSFPAARERREGRDRLPAGRAGNRRDAAVADRPRHRRNPHRALLLGVDMGEVRHVDIVASAHGKIVPSGRVKLIQPLETGVVRAIHIHDGQSVKAGNVLIELDPTLTTAEQEHIRSDLVAAQLDIARLRAALSDSDNPQSAFQPPIGASSGLVAMQRGFPD